VRWSRVTRLSSASSIGFLGNEAVAVFRIRIGRQINSAALIADGYHARTDGLTSLAVVLGALGVWLGYALSDPLIGLLITVAILGIVWQSTKAVLTRMLDSVEPDVAAELRHAAEHARGVRRFDSVRARWLGHRLHAEMTLAIDSALSVAAAEQVAQEIREHARHHLPALVLRPCPHQGVEDLSTVHRPNTSTITELPTSSTILARCRQLSLRASSPIKRSRVNVAASATVATIPIAIAAVTAKPAPS
jgi:divalent metal cation (Fe/Co/Zn/Cd) transporter